MSGRSLALLAVVFYLVSAVALWHEGLHEEAAIAVVAAPFAVVLALKP